MPFEIPPDEIEIRASRASGPGGQHVNKASTRIEARWSISTSPSLTPEQRERLLRRLKSRVDSSGVLRVAADQRRSQLRNREAALARLHQLVRQALHEPKPRKPTRPSRAAKEARLEAKARRARQKRDRSRSWDDDAGSD